MGNCFGGRNKHEEVVDLLLKIYRLSEGKGPEEAEQLRNVLLTELHYSEGRYETDLYSALYEYFYFKQTKIDEINNEGKEN